MPGKNQILNTYFIKKQCYFLIDLINLINLPTIAFLNNAFGNKGMKKHQGKQHLKKRYCYKKQSQATMQLPALSK